jgi:lactoylglutathione lyase
MIKGLYETHLYVSNLENSIAFYTDVLKLKQCYSEEDRRCAFFWIGSDKQSMLGLWEKPKEEIDIRHFAFECSAEFVLYESIPFLKKHQIPFRNFLRDGTERAMVFCWIPAVSIYFDDPDGHSLEFIGRLDGEGQADLGILSYEDWQKTQN